MNDRKTYIMKRLTEHYEYSQKKGYTVVCLMLQGSQNYGLDEYSDEYQSDIDSKAIVLPDFRDIVYEKPAVSAVEILENGEHIDVKDIRVMFEMFEKQNLSYIELLYTDFRIINPHYADLISPIFMFRSDIAALNRNQFLRCILGMSGNKVKALCHPYPNLMDKINKYGFDGKQLSHCARLYELTMKVIKGLPLEECYPCVQFHDICMNYKKQLAADGSRYLTQEEAIELCAKYFDLTDALVRSNLLPHDEVNTDTIKWMDEIKYNVLRRKFMEDICNEEIKFR